MRQSIVIALALASSFALTACGNGHKGVTKAKVALAKATGDKGTQKKNVREIEQHVQKKNGELLAMNFHGLEDGVSFGSVLSSMKTFTPEERQKIKAILSDVKTDGEEMINAGKDLKGAEGDQAKTRGEQLKSRAMSGIQKMNEQEKIEKEKAESNQLGE